MSIIAERVRAAFAEQAPGMEALGSPFMARLMRLMAERLAPGDAVSDHVLNWPGDPRGQADNVSMRLAGGLHALVISRQDATLAAAYPPNQASDDTLWQALESAFRHHAGHLLDWLSGPPQTNEVRRAAAVIPAMHLVAAWSGLPLALWEIGCSGGLALRADRFHLDAGGARYGPPDSPLRLAPEWTGPAPVPAKLAIVGRHGVDLAPLDPSDPTERLRLRAYLWPDQPERLALTDAAIAIAQAHPARIEQADAVGWLAATLSSRPRGAATFLFHTVAWQYLPPDARARGEALIAEAGENATNDAPLARFGMEGDGAPLARLTLRRWPGDRRLELGRADFHGRSVHWQA